MKRTRIEVISVRCRVVSRSGTDVQDGRGNTEIGVLLSDLSDIVSAAEEMPHKMNEDGVEILRPEFQSLRLRLSRMREYLHRLKTKGVRSHEE